MFTGQITDDSAVGSTRAAPQSNAPQSDTPQPAGQKRSGLGQRACLDGIRGAALLAVIFFHLDYGWAAGAYFSVDVFFVLSGFLITSLLLHEFLRAGHINLAKFWSRRARRLIPGLLLALVVIALLGKLTLPSQDLGQLRRDSFAALGYVSNWVQAGSGTNYFDLFASRSLLEHFWTLAIEEQFYLVWPFIAAALFAWATRRRSSKRSTVRYGHPLIAVGVVGALASAAWMAYLYQSRGQSIVGALYFRTDTRAQAILMGVAAAGVVARLGRVDNATHRQWWDRAGIAAAVAIIAIMAWHPSDAVQYQGVFLVIAVLSALLIASPMLAADGRLNRALDNPVLRYCGTLSYGLYLWHWPVFQVLTPERTGLPWLINDGLRLAVTFGAAELSARLIEIPVRKGAFRTTGVRTAFLSIGSVAALVFAATAGATLTDAQRYARDQKFSAAPPVVVPPVTKTLVVGDAFGASLGTTWSSPTNARTNLAITNAAEAGCALTTKCPAAPSQWIAKATADKPDVVVLAMASWLTFDNTGKEYNAVDFNVRQALVSQIVAVTEQFRALGVRVVAVTPLADAVEGPTSIASTRGAFEESKQATNGWLTVYTPAATTCPTESCMGATTPVAGTPGLSEGFLTGLGADVRQVHVDSVTKSGATDSRLRVLIVGDSVAWSLGSGWYDGSSRPPADAKVLVWNRGQFFCGLDELPGFELGGALRAEGTACPNWRTTWAADVATFDPDIVLLPASVWTTLDREIDGERVEWESPRYQERLKALYTEAGMLLSANGAKVGFLSEPPTDNEKLSNRKNALQTSRAGGQSLLIAQIVAEHPDKFAFLDYAGFVCPDTNCPEKIDGVVLRPDNLHLSAAGSAIVAKWLEPQLIALGAPKAATGDTTTTTPASATSPTSTTVAGSSPG